MPRDSVVRGLEVEAALAAAGAVGVASRDGVARGLEVETALPAGAATKISRGGVARGVEVEGALPAVAAAGAAWRLREAMVAMDVDSLSLQLPTTELDDDGALDPSMPNKVILDGEDSSDRVNGLIVMQKRLTESISNYQARKRVRSTSAVQTWNARHMDIHSDSSPTPVSPQNTPNIVHGGIPVERPLPSLARKRMRTTSAVNPSNIVHDIQSASSPTLESPVHKRSRRAGSKKSLVWKHVTPGSRGQQPIATCNYCGQEYNCDPSIHGTSTLWNHLRFLCPQQPLKGQELQRKSQWMPKHSYSIEDCRKALAEMVLIDEMPFTTVEGEGFKRYSKVLQPRFDLPSRVTVARDCMQRYVEEKPKLKKLLRNQRICLTTDTWTSNQNLCYMCLTGHWIDDEWRLQKRILNFCSVADHKGETLGKRVEECLLDWGIDHLFTVTVDNASSNDRLIGYLKGVCKDWQGVVLNNKFLHVRCCAHIVNLVVKSGLEEHNMSINKIRTAVKFVRSSPSRLKIFNKCAELEKISSKSLLTLDLETKWNATFLMLESAEKFEKAFADIFNHLHFMF